MIHMVHAGLVGGEVQLSDETYRAWSEGLFALSCFSDMQ